KLKRRSKLVFAAPLIGGIYPAGDAAVVKRLVYKALSARKSFEINRPSWPLPLHDDAIDEMFASPYPSLKLQAFYADSWKRTNWDFRHTAYGQFRDRLLWSPNCPPNLVRERGETAPAPLPGFDDETLRWLPPDGLAPENALPIVTRIRPKRLGASLP